MNENIDDILSSIQKWYDKQPLVKTPNQCDDKYYVIDIGCSTDVALMHKHYDWNRVFRFFNQVEGLKSTFATKYPTRFKPEWYPVNPDKHRIRVSLMPQKYSDILEPNTDKIEDRIACIKPLQEHMEVHINFSPIIYEEGWLEEYEELFKLLKAEDIDVPCECIFLTYNNIQHERNSEDVNQLCWKPDIQEAKDSQYAPDNIRYQWQLKKQMIEEFKTLYSKYFNLKNIRYIF